MLAHKDYAIAALVGFFTGVFAIPLVFNIGFKNPVLLASLPLIVPPIWVLGVWFGHFLSRWLAVMAQFSKFVAVGFLNFSIDFGVINLLSLITGITSGLAIGGVNVPGFSTAALNSYFWNKKWVFHKVDDKGFFHDFPLFLAVSAGGLIINSGLVIVLTTYVNPVFDIRPELWLNASKAAATSLSLIWNFTGYKFIVFRRHLDDPATP